MEGGGEVFFTIKVVNYVNSAYSIRGYVMDEDGDKVYPEDGEYFEARLPANGNYTAYFDLPVSGIGNHTYTLYVDNYGSESHTDSTKIQVKPGNGGLKQIAFECDDLYFTWEFVDYHATLICKAVLYNPTFSELGIASINGMPDIRVSINAISLTPTELKHGMNTIEVSVDSPIIMPQGYDTLEFRSEISGVPLTILETQLYGSIYSITLPYTVYFANGSQFKAVGYGGGKILQDNAHVLADTALNAFLFKGTGSTLKAVLIARDVSKAGEAVRVLIGILKEIVGWYKWLS